MHWCLWIWFLVWYFASIFAYFSMLLSSLYIHYHNSYINVPVISCWQALISGVYAVVPIIKIQRLLMEEGTPPPNPNWFKKLLCSLECLRIEEVQRPNNIEGWKVRENVLWTILGVINHPSKKLYTQYQEVLKHLNISPKSLSSADNKLLIYEVLTIFQIICPSLIHGTYNRITLSQNICTTIVLKWILLLRIKCFESTFN